MSCSLLDIVGGVCGAEERARHQSTQTVSLSSCSKDIRSHKRFLQFSGVETEIELILARSGIFVKPFNFWKCPLHRSESDGEELVDYVLCHRMFPVTKRNLKKYPQQKGELLCSTQNKIFELTKNLVPVGSNKRSQ